MNRIDRELLAHARELRADLTKAESIVWSALRGRRFCGLKWRRQVPWNGFVLDFFCAELQLVIELDGTQHGEPEHRAYDDRRRQRLERAGMKVVRLSNIDVLYGLKDLLGMIRLELERCRTVA